MNNYTEHIEFLKKVQGQLLQVVKRGVQQDTPPEKQKGTCREIDVIGEIIEVIEDYTKEPEPPTEDLSNLQPIFTEIQNELEKPYLYGCVVKRVFLPPAVFLGLKEEIGFPLELSEVKLNSSRGVVLVSKVSSITHAQIQYITPYNIDEVITCSSLLLKEDDNE